MSCEAKGFGNPNGWKKAQLVVYDFDSMTDSDFIGQARSSRFHHWIMGLFGIRSVLVGDAQPSRNACPHVRLY